MGEGHAPLTTFALERLGVVPGSHLLDVGCGAGVALRAARLRRFYSQFVTPGSLCVDVGAHVGNRVRAWRAERGL